MGQRGPAPTPREILSACGSWRAARAGEAPQPPRGVPKCPAWLGKTARKHYRRLAVTLDGMGVLTLADGDALAGLAVALVELEEATALLESEGRVITAASGYKQPHPAVAQQRSALGLVKDFSALFGLDPASRTRVRVAAEGKSEPAVLARDRGQGRYFPPDEDEGRS